MNSMDYQATLQKGIVPFFNRGNRKKTHTFQQDNAAIHKSSSTMNWFSAKKITVLNWPANSPDLNPIENVWGLLARAVYRHGKQFQTVGELKDAVTEEWDKLQPSYLESLTQSMSNRLCQVMQKFGGPTSY
uniref:DDE_3 domain-containing protein n=2 Tax=Caenorhabditis japonica TaxID=281687 RepID=A0A8R1EDZ0_CAEJA